MIHQQALEGGAIMILIILLGGCGGNTPAAVLEAPAATAVPAQVATILTSEPVTPTPEPPRATPTSEPATSTPTAEPTATLTSEPPPTTEGEAAVDPLEAGNPERGREIFENGGGVISAENSCSQCHSLDGTVKEHGSAGPSFQGISERAGNRVPELVAVEYLRQSIVAPNAYVVEGFSNNRMPKAYKFFLSEEEIDDLIAFMLTQ